VTQFFDVARQLPRDWLEKSAGVLATTPGATLPLVEDDPQSPKIAEGRENTNKNRRSSEQGGRSNRDFLGMTWPKNLTLINRNSGYGLN
jgi:hypothetical protein